MTNETKPLTKELTRAEVESREWGQTIPAVHRERVLATIDALDAARAAKKEAEELLTKQRGLYQNLDESFRQVLQERDAARAESNGYAQQAGALRRERDEARRELDETSDLLVANTALLKEAEKLHEEDQEAIDALGQVCCGVAFTSGQYEEANALALSEAECAYCREKGPRTPEAMTAHATRCEKHPLSAAIAERDLANAMHAEASRQRDACAAEVMMLRGELASCDCTTQVCPDDSYSDKCTTHRVLAQPSASAAHLDARLAEARREQAQTDFEAWVFVIRSDTDVAHIPTEGAQALAERDARVRAAALEPLLGIIPHQHCESCTAFVRALAATAPSAPAKDAQPAAPSERCAACGHDRAAHEGHTVPTRAWGPGEPKPTHCSQGCGCREFVPCGGTGARR